MKVLRECVAVKPGENVLIVTDIEKLRIAESLVEGAYIEGAEVSTCVMSPRKAHGEEPPKPIASAMKNADAVLIVTKYAMTHCKARHEAQAAGVRLCGLPGITEKFFTGGGLMMDFVAAEPIVKKVAKLFGEAKSMRVTTSVGTDLRTSKEGKKALSFNGLCREPGSFASLPSISVNTAPLEDSLEGRMVVDFLVSPYIVKGGLLNKPIKVTFKNGTITDIEGEQEAEALKKLLKSYNSPNVYRVVQLGIGLNPWSEPASGAGVADDENKYGNFVMGLGEGRSFGSSISAPAHWDLVMSKPTLELDGKTIQKDGELTIEGALEVLGKPRF